MVFLIFTCSYGVPNFFYLFVWSALYMLQYLANASVATFDHCQLNRGHIYYLNNVQSLYFLRLLPTWCYSVPDLKDFALSTDFFF